MQIYHFKHLSDKENIVHGISTKDFGSMKNENGRVINDNLSMFLKNLNLPESAICMGQVHGSNVVEIKTDPKLLINNTDGLITDRKNIPLCVLTADCLPIVFVDTHKNVIGIAHCGRKGLIAGIIKKMISKFKKEFGSDPLHISVGVGPGIEKSCYEVNGVFLDIRKLANNLLIEEGIDKKNIENIDRCTKCSSEALYSYRGGDRFDRFATVISLV